MESDRTLDVQAFSLSRYPPQKSCSRPRCGHHQNSVGLFVPSHNTWFGILLAQLSGVWESSEDPGGCGGGGCTPEWRIEPVSGGWSVSSLHICSHSPEKHLAGQHPLFLVLPRAAQVKSLPAPWLGVGLLMSSPTEVRRAGSSMNPRPSQPLSGGRSPSSLTAHPGTG